MWRICFLLHWELPVKSMSTFHSPVISHTYTPEIITNSVFSMDTKDLANCKENILIPWGKAENSSAFGS